MRETSAQMFWGFARNWWGLALEVHGKCQARHARVSARAAGERLRYHDEAIGNALTHEAIDNRFRRAR